MFQAGEVDYLVATDAIGMGLNMDVDHVAFAELVKFDGRAPRRLAPAEIAQIAGRAGRHMSDGTFGTTAEPSALEPEIVEAVENHRFDPLDAALLAQLRLDFGSLGGAATSLDAAAGHARPRPGARGGRPRARALWRKMPESPRRRANPATVRLLWEVCQIPDFRKVMSETHARLLARIYRHLAGPGEAAADRLGGGPGRPARPQPTATSTR